jgi:hypothetical protein
MWIVLPPVEADLLGLIHRAHQEAYADGQQLDIGERNPDITRNYQPFIKNPIQDID